MKKMKQALILLLIISTIQVQAQWSVGIKAGYVKAWEDYGDVELPADAEIDVRGFKVAGMAYLEVGKHFQVGVEPGYVERGAACVPGWGDNFGFVGDTKLFLKYVEMHLMLAGSYKVFRDKVEVFGKLGYGAAFLASAIQEEEVISFDEKPVITKIDLNDDGSRLNRWDHGAYGGLGIAYYLGKGKVFVESQFYNGLKDADRFNASENRSLDLSLGYLITL